MIIPDKDLLLLSLDSFFTDELKQNSTTEWTDKLPLLINDYALSYFYSNRFIYNEVLKERVAKKYIGFGLEYKDANLGKFTSQDSAEISKTTRKGFGRLLHSKNEILECSEIFDGESFINQDATVQSFIKNAPDADILHIAAHGFVSLDLPMSSGLVFSKTSKEKDNILRESNIYKMDINSEVVILSACNTANGVIHKGEGIRSLSRAFTYAGCSNVTASLWSAPDFSTKEIIVPYLKYLKEGLPKDVALQQAKLEYIDNCEFNKDALPCNWSHLISTGNQDPISFEEGWSFW